MDERALARLSWNGRADAIDELFTRLWPIVRQWAFAVIGDLTRKSGGIWLDPNRCEREPNPMIVRRCGATARTRAAGMRPA